MKLIIVVLIALAASAWWQRPSGDLELIIPAVKGDALIIRAPDGAVSLIDGGSQPTDFAVVLGRVLPFYQRTLHLLLLSRADSLRLPGSVAALSRYRPTLAFAPLPLPKYGEAAEWQRLLSAWQRSAQPLQAGQQVSLGAGAQLAVLAHQPGRDGGTVLLLRYHECQALIHSGSPELDAEALARYPAPVDLLIFPWQRELPSELRAAWQPRQIIFSEGYQTDHPPHLTFAARSGGAQLFHEKIHGELRAVCDTARFIVE